AKKRIDTTFRRYISAGVADGSIRGCDPKLAAFAIAGSLNWIGHWYRRDGALSPSAIAGEFTARLTDGLAVTVTWHRTSKKTTDATRRRETRRKAVANKAAGKKRTGGTSR